VVFSFLVFALHLLIVNFLMVVSACRCRLVKLNYVKSWSRVQLGYFYYVLFCFFGILKLFCQNKFNVNIHWSLAVVGHLVFGNLMIFAILSFASLLNLRDKGGGNIRWLRHVGLTAFRLNQK
jgi:hypothetical protein